MKVDIKSLLLGAALVLMGYVMGSLQSNTLLTQTYPQKLAI